MVCRVVRSTMALSDVKVVELAGLAPAPFCGMVLSDFGASVLRVDRMETTEQLVVDRLCRGKRSICLNLKNIEGVDILRRLCLKSDVLIEPFRPGVMERLGLGPEILLAKNPRLIYARLTGFGQTGPMKSMAGHDINYLALSGLLSMLGRKGEKPTPPLNLLADFAGGGLLCAFGIVLALLEQKSSGLGQVIDASMVEGTAYLGSWIYKTQDLLWNGSRGENLLDSGFPLYDTYETKDGQFIAVGALEPKFQTQFLNRIGLTADFGDWDKLRCEIAAKIKKRTQQEWGQMFNGTDACVTPVLNLKDAPNHLQNKARFTFSECGEPRPAPVFSRTPVRRSAQSECVEPGQNTEEVLAEHGYSKEEIMRLSLDGTVKQFQKRLYSSKL